MARQSEPPAAIVAELDEIEQQSQPRWAYFTASFVIQ